MKIAITATGTDLQAQVDPRFGRAGYFIIVDPETMEFEAIENSSISAAHGAGIQSGQLMSSKDVSAVITGSVGPNAFQTLTAAGIQIFQSPGGTVQQAVDAYKNGRLQPVTNFGPAHAGMGTGGGMGMGRGIGMGRGMGAGAGFNPPPPSTAPKSKEQELQELKVQAEQAGQQLEAIKKRISELEKQ
jgi:predicted Fe-Mo cluster-binding NifX family protein